VFVPAVPFVALVELFAVLEFVPLVVNVPAGPLAPPSAGVVDPVPESPSPPVLGAGLGAGEFPPPESFTITTPCIPLRQCPGMEQKNGKLPALLNGWLPLDDSSNAPPR